MLLFFRIASTILIISSVIYGAFKANITNITFFEIIMFTMWLTTQVHKQLLGF